MTIDEAIEKSKELASTYRIAAKNAENIFISKLMQETKRKIYIKLAEEHEQLAEWLEELKEYKATLLTPQMIEDLKKSEKQAHKTAIQNAMLAEDSYNKALDDIVTIIKERVGMDWEWDFCFIEQIAEQLKEQK